MRIRVVTFPPLSTTKVWSSLSNLPSAATVNDLKHSLCKQVPALKGLKTDQIRLFVDDFELLEALSIDVVRENDTVQVKRIGYSQTSILRKRKRSPSSSSSSFSSSSSSSSEASSDSSSDSESTTDSASDSGPSLSKPKAVKPSERQPVNKRPPVPPGKGKPATHRRNIRRRKKLQHERNTVLRDPDDPTVGVNAIPIGNHNRAETAETTTQTIADDREELTMASLSNKNKRRGFKSAMGKEVPSKIVFSGQVDSKTNVRALASTPRMVPPSEKQEKGLLPPNIFVTSVDVEEGFRQGKKPKSVIPNVKRSGTPPASCSAGVFDYAAIESKWDSLGLVSSVTELPTGTIVGWKALGINPVTITPEVMLHVGAVVSCDENQVTVKISDRTGALLGSEEDVEEIEESHSWGDIVNQWRIMTLGRL